MNASIESSGNIVIAYLFGEIDHCSARETREQLDMILSLKKPEKLIMDFKNVTFMDSSGIGLVMGRYRTISSFKGKLEIRNVSKQTKKLFQLAGIGTIAEIKEDIS